MAFTEDLGVFFTLDTPGAVSVSFAGSPAGMVGIRDMVGALELASITGAGEGAQLPGVQATDKTILIRSDQVGALVPGMAMTVASAAVTARSVLPVEDGQITLVAYR